MDEILQGEFSEIKTMDKDILGKGMFHHVYPSAFNPNIVYKIGSEETVNSYYDIFVKNPQIFPRVYKRGSVDVKTFGGVKVSASYVMLEKLNTKPFEDFWLYIDEYFDNEFQNKLKDYNNSYDELVSVGQLVKKNEGIGVYKRYMNLLKLVQRLLKIKKYPDIHIGQFGYDNNGKLKCLDF